MPLVLRPGEDADATRMAEIERTAFADNKLTPFLFPDPFPDEALEKRAEGLIAQRQNDPTTRWVKVVDTDTDTDELVAYAKWNIMDKPKDPEPGRQEFGPGCNIEMCKEYFGGIYRKRAELMGGKAYCCKSMGSSLYRLQPMLTGSCPLIQCSTSYRLIHNIRAVARVAC
jgi:hypothetical protein